MSWLGGKRIAAEVAQCLEIEPGARVVVGFDAKLAARLAASGAAVTFVSDVERDVSRATTSAFHLDALETELSRLDGAVIVGAASRDDASEVVASFGRVLDNDARLALVDRVQRRVVAKAALLGGLSRLEQRGVGRVVITVGRQIASRFPASAES